MGEKWPRNFAESGDFHLFYMPLSTTWDRWLYFPSEGRRTEVFFGFEPANLGTKGQHATSRPPETLERNLRILKILVNKQQGRQCAYNVRTYNVILRRDRATIVSLEKSIFVTYRECVFLALGFQHAMRKHHFVICGLPASTIFFHVIS
jgi:hypothetical protein